MVLTKGYLGYLHLNLSFSDSIGLADGKAGALVALRSVPERFYRRDLVMSFLGEIFQQVGSSTPLNLGDGVAGIGTVLEFLFKERIVDANTSELLEDIEPFILNVIYAARCEDISVSNGLSGYGLYLLHRYKSENVPDSLLRLRLRECLVAAVDQIEARYSTLAKSIDTRSLWDGLPGVCFFLSCVDRLGFYKPTTDSLLKSMKWEIQKSLEGRDSSLRDAFSWLALMQADVTKSGGASVKHLAHALRNDVDDSLSVSEACFIYCGLKYLAFRYRVAGLRKVYKRLGEVINQTCERSNPHDVFRYDPNGPGRELGLRTGVSALLLFEAAYKRNHFAWKSIFGIE